MLTYKILLKNKNHNNKWKQIIQCFTLIKSFQEKQGSKGTEEEGKKKKKHQETPNQQRKSLVAGEIYDRLLAAEIDSLSKLIRNGVFAFLVLSLASAI